MGNFQTAVRESILFVDDSYWANFFSSAKAAHQPTVEYSYNAKRPEYKWGRINEYLTNALYYSRDRKHYIKVRNTLATR